MLSLRRENANSMNVISFWVNSDLFCKMHILQDFFEECEMLKLPRVKKETKGNVSEIKKIKKVLASVAIAIGLTVMGTSAIAAHEPATIQPDQQTIQASLLLTPSVDNPVLVAQHWSHSSHRSHSSHWSHRSHSSHYSSRY